MPVIVVANPKGGVGKSTLSTHIAGYFAARGQSVMLGDADRQLSSKLWLSLRPTTAQPISNWEVDRDDVTKTQIGIVGMRVDERTRAAEQLRSFVESTGLPVLGYVRNTQNYVQLAARGLTKFDLAPERVVCGVAQWQVQAPVAKTCA